jgi:tryptophan-rich sensory protein
MAVSKVLKTVPWKDQWPVLAVYCTHLALGDAWNDVFFGYQRIGLGAIVISVFFGFLLTSAKLFWDIDPVAGKLMLPTCGWVFIASSLNLSIFAKNKK